MGKSERISGLFWFIFAVMIMVASYRLGMGSLRRPGPGFFFFWAGLFMGILALIVLVQAWALKRKGTSEPLFRGRNILKVLLVLASVFLYAIFIERLGFVPVTFLLFIFILWFMEKKGALFAILASLLVTASAYVIFKVLLQSQLPTGWLGF